MLHRWQKDPSFWRNFVACKTIPPREARLTHLPDDLHPALAQALRRTGIDGLFSHQMNSWDCAQEGKHQAIVTGTASGKTLCYTLPVLDRLLRDPTATALYLFPTKALAHDQLSSLLSFLEVVNKAPGIESHPVSPGAYDGDTPRAAKVAMRTSSRIILTNPDMLHTAILPHHTRWAHFLSNLRFIVLDEMHTYRGVFGSHVANVLRRLKRILRHYGAHPLFFLTSATIANPADLAERLIEAPVAVVGHDGSPRGEKHFLIYNPPVIEPDFGLRASLLGETSRLAVDLLAAGCQTIVFGRTRRAVERMLLEIKNLRTLRNNNIDSGSDVRAYRSGYLPTKRREIEAGLKCGDVKTVIATSALELGIDIGQMEAVLMAGFPGTIAGIWQQAGRAGRGTEPSLAILVTSSTPLDQFLAQHPEFLFSQNPENALINADNILILLDHIQCAAFELPFKTGETFGNLDPETLGELLAFLKEKGVLHQSGETFFWMAGGYPAAQIPLRNASPTRFLLHSLEGDSKTTIGEVDAESALWMVHPQAVYIHEGNLYLVEDLDLDAHTVTLKPVDVDYYTRPRQETEVELEQQINGEAVPGGWKAFGDVVVSNQVTGFQRVLWRSNEVIDFQELTLPKTELHTQAYWLSLSDESREQLLSRGLWAKEPNNYGPEWEHQREQARKRDLFRCQVCGAAERGNAHHVHHIKPFKTFATPEAANRLENLVTLCPTCHLRVESRVRMRSGLSGLGYVLSHLAPIFLMCEPRDLGVHADAKLQFAGGKPGVVIYEKVPGGVGFSPRIFELHTHLIHHAVDLVRRCPCLDGCPACVGPGGEEGSGGKQEALGILELLSSSQIFPVERDVTVGGKSKHQHQDNR